MSSHRQTALTNVSMSLFWYSLLSTAPSRNCSMDQMMRSFSTCLSSWAALASTMVFSSSAISPSSSNRRSFVVTVKMPCSMAVIMFLTAFLFWDSSASSLSISSLLPDCSSILIVPSAIHSITSSRRINRWVNSATVRSMNSFFTLFFWHPPPLRCPLQV